MSQESECVNVRFVEHVVATISLDLAGYTSNYSYSDYIRVHSLAPPYSEENISQLIGHNDVRRGDVSISLVSPHGTESRLLPHRRNDFVNVEGFDSWPFMSVLHWGESPLGEWLLNISYDPLKHRKGHAILGNLSLTLYGTHTVPESVSNIPAICNEMCYDTCAGEGKSLCDRCILLRHSRTLDCVITCPPEFNIHNGYCVDPSNVTYEYKPADESPKSASVTDSHLMTSSGTVPTQENVLRNGCHYYSILMLSITTSLCSTVVMSLVVLSHI